MVFPLWIKDLGQVYSVVDFGKNRNDKLGGRTMSMIIAAMPAYNEDEHIAKLVLSAKKHVDKVVVVDDGSEDMTAELAEALGAMVVRHEENRGYGAAIRTCFETANNFFSKEKTLTKRE